MDRVCELLISSGTSHCDLLSRHWNVVAFDNPGCKVRCMYTALRKEICKLWQNVIGGTDRWLADRKGEHD